MPQLLDNPFEETKSELRFRPSYSTQSHQQPQIRLRKGTWKARGPTAHVGWLTWISSPLSPSEKLLQTRLHTVSSAIPNLTIPISMFSRNGLKRDITGLLFRLHRYARQASSSRYAHSSIVSQNLATHTAVSTALTLCYSIA